MTEMKILFINPPVEDFFFTPQRAYPLGILSLATVLNQAGFPVKILNCPHEYTKQTLKFPLEFSYLRSYYSPNKSPFRLFSHYYGFGSDDFSISETVKQFRPDVVGISANFSAYFDSSLKVAGLVKRIDKRIVVILGGRVPTVQPRLALSSFDVDFVLRGEAEYSFLKLCRAIEIGKIPVQAGLCYRNTDNKMRISRRIPIINDLNRLPILNRKLIDYTGYKFQGDISTSFLASRGCGMHCDFCAIQERFRYRKAKNILKEMEECFSLGVRHFNFEDDNINFNPEFEKILDMVIDKFEGKIKLSFMNGVLSLNLQRRLKEKLVRAGLTHLDLSIVSSNPRLREKMNRRENTRTMFSLAGFMTRRKIPVTVHFIIAFPGQEFKDAARDLRFLAAKPIILGPSIFYPVIESRMFEGVKSESFLSEENYRFFRSSTACFDKLISRDRIFLLFYSSRIINFIKELIGTFIIKDGDIARFLRRKTNKFSIKNNLLYSKAKLKRSTLGMILLRELIAQGRIYRVEETKKSNIISYRFFKEEFVSSQDVKYILSGLTIKGLSGRVAKIGSIP